MKKSKLSSMLLALLISFSMWLYVGSNVSTEDDITFYNIPVIMEGEAKLSEQNLMITNVSAERVSLNLSGQRNDLNKVDNSNIIAKVNLATIEEPGEKIALPYSVSYNTSISNNALVVEKREPQYIYVDVDLRRTKEVPVKVKWTGARSENYIYDTENAVMDYPEITVVGPASVADRIDHASIEVNLTDRAESISESFRYTLCDVNGNPVDAKQITTNMEEIHLETKIQKIKEIQLLANVIYGGGASELNTTVKVEPASIRVSGGEALLEDLGDSIQVCTINLAELEKVSSDLAYTISLPEGITNETGVNEALVSIRINGVSTREITIGNFQTVNVPEGLEAEIINANLTVKVRGPSALILTLKEENMTAVVDFASAEIGTATYKANIQFGEGYEEVGALKTYSVSAMVRAAEE